MAYVNDETVIEERKGDSDIYALREPTAPPETESTPTESEDIFAVKKEHSSVLGSLIGMVLGEGVFLGQAYRIDKPLARDEMGETWKASDLQESRSVVVHFPPPEMRKDETAIEPIRQNAKHVEALEHPRIVPLLANLTDPEHGFFTVRKLVPGKTLDVYRTEYVKRHGKIAPTKIIKMLVDIARALHYAHGVDVVHGDLCLKNIIVGLDDEVYVDNFSLMPVLAETASVERRPYLAPEMVEGGAATPKSDIYALAVIAYNLLSGRLPFSQDTTSQDTAEDTPLPIPDVPSTVDAIIRKAMAKEPGDRYDLCMTFVKDLETSFQESKKQFESVVVTPVSKPVKKIDPARVTFWYSLIGLICIVVGVSAVVTLPTILSESSSKQEDQQADNPAPDARQGAGRIRELPPDVQPPVAQPSRRLRPDVATTATEEIEVEPEVPPVPQVEPEVPPVPQVEPEAPPPIVVIERELPQQDHAVSSSVSEQQWSVSLVNAMREEGTTTEITIGGIEYRFRWCKPLPMGMNGFWIQETLVTRESWLDVMGRNSLRPQPADGRRLPARAVSRNECAAFARRLNDEPNILSGEEFDIDSEYQFLLPTVAQWDYADGLEFLKTTNGVLEWCSDNEEGDHAVRNPANRRIPSESGYNDVGFRLVIVPVAK